VVTFVVVVVVLDVALPVEYLVVMVTGVVLGDVM
jgi:hypothetical protein